MKHLIFAVFVCLTMTAVAHPIQPAVSRAVTRAVATKQQVSLAAHITQQLQTYYQRTDFKDPDHQTGWYRVDDFLTWLNANEKELAQEKMIVIDHSGSTEYLRNPTISLQEVINIPAVNRSSTLMRAFWMNIGIHYIASKYQAGIHLNPIEFESMPNVLTAIVGPSYFHINLTDPPQVFPMDINIGIHEGTHGLFDESPSLHAQAPQVTEALLSELATFYSQYHYSLPVKIADGKTFPLGGVRYILNSYQAYPDFNYELEYKQFIIGPLIAHNMTVPQVLTLLDDPLQPDVSIWESVFIFLAAKSGHYLSVDVDATAHQLYTSKQNLVATAQQFGFTQTDVEQWLNSPSTFIDLGTRQWPQTTSTENIVLWKRKHADAFVFIGQAKRHSVRDFFNMTFGPYAQDPKIAQFYDELLKALPPIVTQVQTQQYPTIVAGQSLSTAYQSTVVPHQEQWRKALVQTLKKVRITQPPIIPPGYL